jgi:hypothetical protein
VKIKTVWEKNPAPEPEPEVVQEKKCLKCWKRKCQILEWMKNKNMETITSRDIKKWLDGLGIAYKRSTPQKILFRLEKSNWIQPVNEQRFGHRPYIVYEPAPKFEHWLITHKSFLESPLCIKEEKVEEKVEEKKVEPKPVVEKKIIFFERR